MEVGYNRAMRYSMRTLLVCMAIGPPVLAVAWVTRAGLVQVGGVLVGVLLAALAMGVCTAIALRLLGY
jgi:hypothetical protein